VTLRLLSRVEAVDLAGPRPVVVLQGGERLEARLLVGADGLHSRVRGALNGAEEPFFTGQVAWRALIPCEPEAAPVAEVHMGPGRHLVSYPLRGGTLRNIVAVEERAKWAEESWTLRDDSMDLRLAFEGFSAPCPGLAGPGGGPLAVGPVPTQGGRDLDQPEGRRDPGRCRASDAALPGAGGQHGAGGCLGAGRRAGAAMTALAAAAAYQARASRARRGSSRRQTATRAPITCRVCCGSLGIQACGCWGGCRRARCCHASLALRA
jgi:hypothetical protein